MGSGGREAELTVKIYVDQWRMINGVINMLLLLLLKRFIGLPAKNRRIFLGALTGCAVSGLTLFGAAGLYRLFAARGQWGNEFFPYGAAALILRGTGMLWGGGLMIRAVWGRMNIPTFFRAMWGMFLIAVLFGGLLYGISSFLPRGISSTGSLLCAAGGSFFLSRAAIRLVTENREKKQRLYPAVLIYQGRECRIMALWDTGNQLTDMLGKRPVHILDSQTAKEVVTTVRQVRYIPYQTIGQPEGVLPATFFDAIRIESEKGQILLNRPLVAFSPQPVSPKGEYQLLLHGSAFERNQ